MFTGVHAVLPDRRGASPESNSSCLRCEPELVEKNLLVIHWVFRYLREIMSLKAEMRVSEYYDCHLTAVLQDPSLAHGKQKATSRKQLAFCAFETYNKTPSWLRSDRFLLCVGNPDTEQGHRHLNGISTELNEVCPAPSTWPAICETLLQKAYQRLPGMSWNTNQARGQSSSSVTEYKW